MKKSILIALAALFLFSCSKPPLTLKPGFFHVAGSTRPTCGEVSDIWLINTGFAMMAEKHMFEGGGKTKKRIPVLCVLIKRDGQYILIDAGLNHHFAFDPGKYLGSVSAFFAKLVRDLPTMKPGQDVVAQLTRLGVSPDQVAKIILTHGHVDHTGELSSFPNARIYLWQKEHEFTNRAFGKLRGVIKNDLPEKQIEDYSFKNTKPHLTFSGGYDLFGDESVVIVPTPGHTPGSVSVSVNTAKRRFLFVGDAAYCMENISKPILTGYNENRIKTWETLLRLHDLAAQQPDIKIIPFHESSYSTIDPVKPLRLVGNDE